MIQSPATLPITGYPELKMRVLIHSGIASTQCRHEIVNGCLAGQPLFHLDNKAAIPFDASA